MLNGKAGMVTPSALAGLGRLWLWTGCSAAVAACAPDGYGMELNPETNIPSGTYTGARHTQVLHLRRMNYLTKRGP